MLTSDLFVVANLLVYCLAGASFWFSAQQTQLHYFDGMYGQMPPVNSPRSDVPYLLIIRSKDPRSNVPSGQTHTPVSERRRVLCY